jgi:hypothetical protein
MITGKDDQRIEYANLSVTNFLEQSYNHKKLIIVNHHHSLDVLKDKPFSSDILEVKVKKEGKTLGDLRNIALQLIGYCDVWTIWDDDDYRSPDYLQYLISYRKQKQDIIVLKNRVEFNLETNTSWVAKRDIGFATFLGPYDLRVQYLKKDTMEDVNMLKDYKHLGYNIKIVDNDPLLYLRLVHSNNTSLYVNKHKDYILTGNGVYSERPTKIEEKIYIREIMLRYYNVLQEEI